MLVLTLASVRMSIGISRFFIVMLIRCLVSELFDLTDEALCTSSTVDLPVTVVLVASIFLMAFTTLGMIRLREVRFGTAYYRA